MKTKMKKQLNCPNCDSLLDVDQLLVTQFEDSIRKDLQSELDKRERDLKLKKEEFQKMSQALEQEREDINDLVSERVKSQLETREKAIKDAIRKEVNDEKVKQLEDLEAELNRKSAQLIELNQTRAKLQRLSREFEEREAKIHLEKERELTERLDAAKITMKEQVQMESFLKIKEKENIIDSLKQKLEEAHQRATQGSMQSQGEAQELVIEEILRELHPHDSIEEVKKGANGADCIQIVRTQSGIEAGRILYESKNTKSWSDGFVTKLKQDNLQAKADIMVIITKTLPKEMKGKYGLIDNVWITTLDNLKDLSLLLRYGLLKTHSVLITQSNKKDKMSLLYDYLTSEEFRATFENILEGFKNLQDSHLDEQRKIQLLWKRRAKHLEQVLNSTIEFYGSIKSISENAIPTIPMLEIGKAS
ncbi:MAG: DUF2130 domain-containing protein [Crocinitomicaceae bacterium]|nr:DUF2130 domain-containing protein [Crocinitomicaceae bacterium]